eukprot:1331541-Prymnesium_polylepis.1
MSCAEALSYALVMPRWRPCRELNSRQRCHPLSLSAILAAWRQGGDATPSPDPRQGRVLYNNRM